MNVNREPGIEEKDGSDISVNHSSMVSRVVESSDGHYGPLIVYYRLQKMRENRVYEVSSDCNWKKVMFFGMNYWLTN